MGKALSTDEKPKIYVIRRGEFLMPSAPIDGELIRDLPSGKSLRADIVDPARSPQQNRLYRALLKKVCENLDGGTTEAGLHSWLKLTLGIVEPVRLKSGKIIEMPGSVAFDKMDHPTFCNYFDSVKQLVIINFLPGVNKAALDREVYAMLGMTPGSLEMA